MLVSENRANGKLLSCMTIDVEDWFHILDSPAVPGIEHWPSLESRIEKNLNELLAVLDSFSVKVTFFWLGWLAARHKNLVRICRDAGHEIASHGYGHVLAYEVGKDAFRKDIVRAKEILEDIIGDQVRGFRAPGFGITTKAPWAFDIIKETGHQYDSSVFPASRGHGGIADSPLGPYFIETSTGHLLEIPMSIIEIFGHRTTFFGGGYLRLASKLMIKWGIDRLKTSGQPLIVYVHPREIDPDQPHLPLSYFRQFKSYVNLSSTLPKLKWLCGNYHFLTMLEMVKNYIRSFYSTNRIIPVMRLPVSKAHNSTSPAEDAPIDIEDHISYRRKFLQVERAMADFLIPVDDKDILPEQRAVNHGKDRKIPTEQMELDAIDASII